MLTDTPLSHQGAEWHTRNIGPQPVGNRPPTPDNGGELQSVPTRLPRYRGLGGAPWDAAECLPIPSPFRRRGRGEGPPLAKEIVFTAGEAEAIPFGERISLGEGDCLAAPREGSRIIQRSAGRESYAALRM